MALVTSAAASLKNTWGFSPQSIPGLQLWLDAADTTSITGTSPVTAWRDKSGTARTVSFTGTNTYTSSPASVNTNGSTAFFQANSDFRKSTVPNASLFLVYKWNNSTAGTDQTLWGTDKNGGFNRGQVLTFPINTSFQYGLTYSSSSPYFAAVSGINNGNLLMYNANYSLGVVNGTFVNVNGSLSTSLVTEGAASPETSFAGIAFGAVDDDRRFPSAVSFSEIIFFNVTLTIAQRQQVEGYLAAKWGLKANLPATHPYYASASIPFNRPFYPTDIPGCTLWLDGADRSSMTFSPGTSNVTAWADKSGTGNNMALTAAGVSYSSNKVTFASGGVMNSALSTTITNGQSVVFIVCEPTSIPASAISMIFACPDITPGIFPGDYSIRLVSTTTRLVSSSTGDIGFNTAYFINGNLGVPTDGIITLLSGPNVIYGLFNRSGTTGFSLSSPFAPGNDPRPFIGHIQEVIVYTGPITTSQRQQVEQYLAWKWGLVANLPPATSHIGKLLPAFSTNFTVKSISGCTLWMDAADRSSLDITGTSVIRWNDKSGQGNHFTVTEGTPVYSTTTTAAALPCVLLPSNSQMLSVSNAGQSGGSSRTMFIVVDTPSSTYTQMATGNMGSSKNCIGFAVLRNATSNYVYSPYVFGTDIVFQTAPASWPYSSTTNIGYAAYNSNNTTMYGNFGTTSSDSSVVQTLNITAGPWYMGDRPLSGTTGFGAKSADNGRICEFIDFNTYLTTQQRQQVEGYLAWKWGLQSSLPSTHAYAKFSP